MGLFKFLKRKNTEIIDLDKIQINQEEQEEEFVQEAVEKKENALENNELNELVDFNKILKTQKEINKDFELILHEYYICKVFSRVALKDNEFNAQLIEIDKYINTIKRKLYNIDRMIEMYKRAEGIDLNEIYRNVEDLLIYEKNIKNRFLEINEDCYGEIKMSTLSVCIDKDNESMEKFYEAIHNFISQYRDFIEAAEDIYYSSGDFLVSLVNQLILCINETKKKEYIQRYNFNYFFSSDVVITLDIKEWISLFNKIKFTMKLIQDVEMDKLLNFKSKFERFEVIYVILMMKHEISSAQRKRK